ncbi:protein of unknown function DUF4243 [Phytophthora cactorum]|nr:protein of unknown function DUF4243 [Phytophthora cactorum]
MNRVKKAETAAHADLVHAALPHGVWWLSVQPLLHGVVALFDLGASEEKIEDFAQSYSTKLEEEKPSHQDVTQPDVRAKLLQESKLTFESAHDLLGKRQNFDGLLALYSGQVQELGIDGAVKKHLPVLVGGLAGALLHSIIQLGYAYRIGGERLVAEGLAYMHYAYLSFDEPQQVNGEELREKKMFSREDAMQLVRMLNGNELLLNEMRRMLQTKPLVDLEIGGIQKRLSTMSGDPERGSSVAFNLIWDTINAYDLAKMNGVFALDVAFWLYMTIEHNDFVILHAVTSAWALQQVEHLLKRKDHERAWKVWLHVALSAFVTNKIKDVLALDVCDQQLEDLPGLEPWRQIVAKTLSLTDQGLLERDLVHAYKLVQVAYCHAQTNDNAFLTARSATSLPAKVRSSRHRCGNAVLRRSFRQYHAEAVVLEGHDGLSAMSSVQTPELTGSVQDSACDYETVDKAVNEHFHPLLHELSRLTFFRYFKVDLGKECPFLPWQDDGMCASIDCAVCECPSHEIPAPWSQLDQQERQEQAGKPCEEQTGESTLSKVDRKNAVAGESFKEWEEVSSANVWATQGEAEETMTYINLLENPERYTGYSGVQAERIWKAIYEENCFTPPEENALDGMCLEERLAQAQQEKEQLEVQFREKFQNVSRIMDCVTCEKCRLWGKLQTMGLGTAIKILLAEDASAIPKLHRNELIALINVANNLSRSVDGVKMMRELEFIEAVKQFGFVCGGAVLLVLLLIVIFRKRKNRALHTRSRSDSQLAFCKAHPCHIQSATRDHRASDPPPAPPSSQRSGQHPPDPKRSPAECSPHDGSAATAPSRAGRTPDDTAVPRTRPSGIEGTHSAP